MDIRQAKRIVDIRRNHADTIYFFADLQNQNFAREDNLFLPETLMQDNCDILKSLYEGTFIDAMDRGKMINLYERIVQGTKEPIRMHDLEAKVSMQNRLGEMVPVSITCYLDLDEQGLIRCYVGVLKPLRKRELEEREILNAFTNDKNPSIFINRIAKFQAAHPERQYAYIQFDIRKFRYINDKYGSDAGDAVLHYINETLRLLCDDDHIFCRLSADIFQVVTYYTSRDEILAFIDMLDERLHRYHDIRFSMSYGVSVAPGTSTTYRKHGDEAGLARVKAKGAILNKALFYEDTLMRTVKVAGEIEEVEEEALRNGEFHVYLQPKYRYDKNQARIIGAEALVRWIDASGRCKSPAEFIPVFEKNGFLYRLDCYVWEQVCRLLRKWLDEGKTPIPISVNVSRVYLHQFATASDIKQLIDKYEIPIELLQLEITETTENEETLEYINKFKKEGFTLLMDDFGSGYSSLSMLKDTPFDVLKMDRSFLDECLESCQGQTIVSHVISMTNDLGLSVVAEGVETRDVADFLYDHGCNVSQGFYFSKPIPIPEFERLWDMRKPV